MQEALFSLIIGIVTTILAALIAEKLYHTPSATVFSRRWSRRILVGLGSRIIHHNSLPRDLIRNLIQNAKDRIWVLDSWIARSDVLPDPSAVTSVNPDVNVNMLILGQEAMRELLPLRLAAVGKPNAAGFSQDAVVDLIRKCEHFQWNVEIKTYETLPVFNMIIIDDHMFIGFYWTNRISSEGPFLEVVDAKSTLYAESEKMFIEMFDKASIYSITNL